MTIGESRNIDWPVNRELRLAAQLLLHHDRPVHRPNYSRNTTDPSVSLPFHPSLTCEQDPKILKLLHLWQEHSTNLKWASYPFPTEHHGLGLGGADSHPSPFTLGCSPSACWRSWSEGANKTTSSAKSSDEIVCYPNRTSSGTWLRLEILSIKIWNRTGDKGQPCQSPTCLNKSELLQAMQTKLLLRLYRDRAALSNRPRTPKSYPAILRIALSPIHKYGSEPSLYFYSLWLNHLFCMFLTQDTNILSAVVLLFRLYIYIVQCLRGLPY